MPQVIIAVFLYFGVEISVATATAILTSVISLGASLVLGAISKLFTKGPGSSALTHQMSSRTVTSRQAVAPWQIMYGKNRAGGIITMLHTTGANNEFLHIVITVAGHEVNAIPLMYFDGVNVPLNGSGDATGNFSGFVHAEFNLGSKDQAAFAGLVAAAGSYWTSAYRQRGRAGAYVRLKWDQTKFPNGVPNITFDIQGRKVYDPRGSGVQTPAFLQKIENDQPVGTATSYTFILPGNVLAGSLLVFINRFTAVTSITDTAGNTWTKLFGGFWYALSCAAGATTVTVNNPSGPCQGIVAEYSGVANLAPDVSHDDTTTGTGTAATSFSVTPTVNGDLILGWGYNSTTNSPTYTAGAGYSLRSTATGKNAFLEDQVQSVAAAITATLTINASDTWFIGIVAFKAAASTGGTIGYSRNAALCVADYLNNASFGLSAQTKYPVIAAMVTQSGMQNFTAANCVDTDVTTKGWDTGTAVPNAFIDVDLGAGNAQEYRRCRLYASAAGYAGIYDVQYSDNHTTFSAAATAFKADVAGWNEIELAPNGAHRYWRLNLTNTPGAGANMMEFEFYSSDLDSVQLVAAANTCDEQVNLAAGGTENRFMVDGSFGADVLPADVITRMNSAMMGSAVYVAGLWGIYPGIYRSPTISLSDADLRAGLSVQTRASHRDLFNGVKGIFISPTNSWQLSDFPPYQDPVYVKEDNNEAIWKDVEFPFTISAAAAQRLAKIELRRMRRQIVVSGQFKLTAYQVQVMDVVQFSHPRFGWANKTFEVVSCQLIYAPDAGGGSALAAGVDMTLHETDSTVYDWTSAEENQIAAPPVPILPQVAVVQPPTGFAINPVEVVRTVDNIRQSFIEATWTAPADQFVISGGHIIMQYKKTADSLWIHAGTLDGAVVKAEIGPLIDAVSYDVQIWAENAAGAKSSGTTLTGTSTGVNFFTTSTVLNPQGSIIPAPSTASPFTTETSGQVAGKMYIRVSWIAQTEYRPDGSTVSITSSASIFSIAAAPTLSQVAGGTRVAVSIFGAIALVKGGKIVSISPSTFLAISANNLLKITSPASVAGYDGWIPLVFVGAATPSYIQNGGATIAFGTDWTEPSTHAVTTTTAFSTLNVTGICYIDLAASPQYFFYPYYDGTNVLFSGGANLGANLANAAVMFLDGHTPLAGSSGFTTTTPAIGGSGSGGGGGCVMIGSRIFPLAGSAISIELPNEEWILLEAGDHVLICTPDHPVISEQRGKMRADQLFRGEILVCDDGGQPIKNLVPLRFKGTKIKAKMPKGHLFWANGILSHNHKP
jgi:hypothetical protein